VTRRHDGTTRRQHSDALKPSNQPYLGRNDDSRSRHRKSTTRDGSCSSCYDKRSNEDCFKLLLERSDNAPSNRILLSPVVVSEWHGRCCHSLRSGTDEGKTVSKRKLAVRARAPKDTCFATSLHLPQTSQRNRSTHGGDVKESKVGRRPINERRDQSRTRLTTKSPSFSFDQRTSRRHAYYPTCGREDSLSFRMEAA
jgi:hypothetical protein